MGYQPMPSLLQANPLNLALGGQPFRPNQELFLLLGDCGFPARLAQSRDPSLVFPLLLLGFRSWGRLDTATFFCP